MDIGAAVRLPVVVLLAIADVRPAIIVPGPHDVELVAALWAMIHKPQLARSRIHREAFGILEPVCPRLGKNRRATEPRIVARNRAIAVDAHDTTREVPPLVRVVEKRMLHPVEIRGVQPETVCSGNKQAAIGSDHHPPLTYPLTDDLDLLQSPAVIAEPPAGDTLPPNLHGPPLCQRGGPYPIVEILQWPRPCRLPDGRREIGEVNHPVFCEVRIKHDFVQPLRTHRSHARHALDRRGNGAIRIDYSHRSAVLGHKEFPVREKRERPRRVQVARHYFGLERRGRCRCRRIGLPGECRPGLGRLRHSGSGECAHQNEYGDTAHVRVLLFSCSRLPKPILRLETGRKLPAAETISARSSRASATGYTL